ncbi:hypothetical protein IQ266_24370 [filamentous cyanobacterium LEGE 11480]|uniref:Uncharacterized protein n=1 Tax=Romeriopsis navalis LEGE 11480 TaxID=2777977 RepID=A0A928VTQ2_9CYAN|nr:hypothetical protein [Romeriopsis navalis]MBE9032876.1 hypothetical protein [Romeriopsis navalis LEGE 11480]
MSNDVRSIAILNPVMPMPEFQFFQVVKVRSTKEFGTIVGMWYVQTEDQRHHWSYRLVGVQTKPNLWWSGEALRSMQR